MQVTETKQTNNGWKKNLLGGGNKQKDIRVQTSAEATAHSYIVYMQIDNWKHHIA